MLEVLRVNSVKNALGWEIEIREKQDKGFGNDGLWSGLLLG